MTKGSPFKLMLFFTLPSLIGNLIQQLYSMVDTIVVGKFVGVNALAALGVTGGYSFMVIGFAIGLGTGFSVIVSQKFGAKDIEGLKKAYAMSILLSAILGLIITLFFFIFSKPLLILINTPENIIDMANSYISIIYLGFLSSIYYNLFSSLLKAVGDGKSPLYFLILSSFLNILLDLVFVLIIPLGCLGVGIATVIAQAISAILSYIYMVRRFPMFRLKKEHFKRDPILISKLLKIGLPSAFQFSVCALGVIIVQGALNNFGSDYVAGYSIGVKVESLITQIFPALGMALSTYAGQNLGAANIKRIKKGFLVNFLMMLVACVVATAFITYLSEPLSLIFLPEDANSDIALNASVQYLKTISYFFFFLAMIFQFRTGCQGLGSGLIPMISSILELSARAVAAFTLPSFLSYQGICLSSPLAWTVAGAILPFLYFKQIKNIENKLKYEKISYA